MNSFWSFLQDSSTNKSTNYRREVCVLLVAVSMALQAVGQSVVTGDAVGTVMHPSWRRRVRRHRHLDQLRHRCDPVRCYGSEWLLPVRLAEARSVQVDCQADWF